MKIPEELVLCLTASIDPNGMPGVTRVDPKARENDYCDCLRFYSENFPQIRRILFIENSGWSLNRLKDVAKQYNPHAKKIEFVSLRCNDFPRKLGKGYGELLLLEKGLEQAALVKDAKYIAKITGRNYLLNPVRIIEKVNKPFELLLDLRDHSIYDFLGIKMCGHHSDTRFLVFTPQFFEKKLRGAYKRCNEEAGYYAENLFYDISKDKSLEGQVIPRFPIEPQFSGLAGHRNKNYGSLKERLKRLTRGTVRQVAPWLYI